jgi:hypothetical protein
MTFATYASLFAIPIALLLIWGVVWMGKKCDEETERERWGE